MSAAYVYDAVRTPFGRYGGALAGVRPDDLAAHVVARARRTRARRSIPSGSTTCCSATPTARARTTATSRAWRCCSPGCPTSVPGTTVNRLCGSSLDAAMQAAPRGRDGRRLAHARRRRRVDVARAVGRCSSPRRRCPAGDADAALDDARLAHGQPARCRTSGRSRSAQSTEKLAGHPRHRRARRRTRSRCAATALTAAAWDAGFYDDWVVPVPGHRARAATRTCAPTHRWRSSAKLKPAFARDGTVTAGNASPLNDGAGALWIGDEAAGDALGREPLARDRRPRRARRRPRRLRHRPGRGGRARRSRGRASAGATSSAVELNEAFAAQSLACLARWPELDPEIAQRQRRRDRDRAPARRLGRAHPRHARLRAAPPRRRLRASPRSASASDKDWRWCCMPDRDPPLDWPDYRSTALRHPKQPLVYLPQQVTETTGPQLGAPARRARSTTTSRASTTASRSASASPSPAGCSTPTAARSATRSSRSGRPTPPAATGTAGTAGRRRWTRTSPAAGARSPTPTGRYEFVTIKPGPYPWGNHPNAWRPGAHPLLAARPLVRAAARDADVLPGRPAVPVRPDLQLGARPGGARAHDQPLLASTRRRRTGRWPTSSTSCSAAATARRSTRRTDGRPRRPRRPSGPYLAIGLPWAEGPVADPDGVRIAGRVLDGAGDPSPTRWSRPGTTTRRRSRAAATDDEGRWSVQRAAPRRYLAVHVLARGLLRHLDHARLPRPGARTTRCWRASRPTGVTRCSAAAHRRWLPIRHPDPGHRARPSSSTSEDLFGGDLRARRGRRDRSTGAPGGRRCSTSRRRSRGPAPPRARSRRRRPARSPPPATPGSTTSPRSGARRRARPRPSSRWPPRCASAPTSTRTTARPARTSLDTAMMLLARRALEAIVADAARRGRRRRGPGRSAPRHAGDGADAAAARAADVVRAEGGRLADAASRRRSPGSWPCATACSPSRWAGRSAAATRRWPRTWRARSGSRSRCCRGTPTARGPRALAAALGMHGRRAGQDRARRRRCSRRARSARRARAATAAAPRRWRDKRNPAAAVSVLACAARVPGLVATVLAAHAAGARARRRRLAGGVGHDHRRAAPDGLGRGVDARRCSRGSRSIPGGCART